MGGYVIPRELRDEKDAFVFSFANRTKQNLKCIEEIAESEKKRGIPVNKISVYEVTQLINSMIGLVTFPKEAFYDKIDAAHAMNSSSDMDNLLRRIRRNPQQYSYQNTYLYNTGRTEEVNGTERNVYDLNTTERLDTLSFIRHIRNALSHEKISVFPYNLQPNEEIKGFVFEDESKIYGRIDRGRNIFIKNAGRNCRTQKFKVVLEIDDIRTMAFAICDIMLAVGRDTYHIREHIEDFY